MSGFLTDPTSETRSIRWDGFGLVEKLKGVLPSADALNAEIYTMTQSAVALKFETSRDYPTIKERWVFPLRLVDQDAIRDAMVSFCTVDSPLSFKLQLMVELSACLSRCPAEFGVVSENVGETIASLQDEAAQKRFGVVVSKQMRQGGEGLAVIAQMAKMRTGDSSFGVGEDFAALWTTGPEARLGSSESVLRDPDTAWRALTAQLQALDAVIPGRMSRFSSQFAANYWTRCFWRSGETLLTHTQRMLAILALIRTSIACDPTVRTARSEGRARLQETFDTVARRVTWVTIRAFEQHEALEAIVESIDPVDSLVETRSLCQI